MDLKKQHPYIVVLFLRLKVEILVGCPQKSISPIYLKEIIKLEKEKVSKPIKLNNNIILIKLNDIRTMNKNNLDVSKIEINVINKKKRKN